MDPVRELATSYRPGLALAGFGLGLAWIWQALPRIRLDFGLILVGFGLRWLSFIRILVGFGLIWA